MVSRLDVLAEKIIGKETEGKFTLSSFFEVDVYGVDYLFLGDVDVCAFSLVLVVMRCSFGNSQTY